MTTIRSRDTGVSDRLGAAVLDAGFFVVLPLVTFAVVGIGFISGDGLALAGRLASSSWELNPNHLLVEPTALLWLAGGHALGVRTPAADMLAWLSVVSGVLALWIFRVHVTEFLSRERLAANVATMTLALLAAFDSLWVSGEPHMIQMPFLVLVMAGIVRLHREEYGWRGAVTCALAGWLAVLSYISNAILLAGALSAVAVLMPRVRVAALASLVGAGALSLVSLLVVHRLAAIPQAFVPWLTSYAGGGVSAQAVSGFGIRGGVGAIPEAAVRSVFGFVTAIADISSLAAAWRRGTPLRAEALLGAAAAAILLGSAALGVVMSLRSGKSHWRQLGVSAIGASAAVVVFGSWWNNSDDQFFFQVGPWIAGLVALALVRPGERRLLRGFVLAALLLNAYVAARRFLLYPRARLVAEIEQVLGDVDMVLVPGRDEVSQLLAYATRIRGRVIMVSNLAETEPPAVGLSWLGEALSSALDGGRTVGAVNLSPAAAPSQPWPLLRSMGYSLDSVRARIGPVLVLRSQSVAGRMSIEVWTRAR